MTPSHAFHTRAHGVGSSSSQESNQKPQMKAGKEKKVVTAWVSWLLRAYQTILSCMFLTSRYLVNWDTRGFGVVIIRGKAQWPKL